MSLQDRLRSISHLQPAGLRAVNGIISNGDKPGRPLAFGGSESVQRNLERAREHQRALRRARTSGTMGMQFAEASA